MITYIPNHRGTTREGRSRGNGASHWRAGGDDASHFAGPYATPVAQR